MPLGDKIPPHLDTEAQRSFSESRTQEPSMKNVCQTFSKQPKVLIHTMGKDTLGQVPILHSTRASSQSHI